MSSPRITEQSPTAAGVELAALLDKLDAAKQDLQRIGEELRSFHRRLTSVVGDGLLGVELSAGLGLDAEAVPNHGPGAGIASLDHPILEVPEPAHDGNGASASVDITTLASSSLKEMYREAARLAHPDRARDAAERVWATQIMADVNLTYASGNVVRMYELVRQLRADRAARLRNRAGMDEALAGAAQIEREMRAVCGEIARLKASQAYRLMQQFDNVSRVGRDPYKDLAAAIGHMCGQREGAPADSLARRNPGSKSGAEVAGEISGPPESELERSWLSGRTFPTEQGELVRSRSLALIADELCELGLRFAYEQPIVGTIAPGILRPDFVFRDRGGRFLVLEHYAAELPESALTVCGNRRRWFDDNGFGEGLRYFVVRDRQLDRPDLEHLRKVAEYILSLTDSEKP